MKNMDLTDKHPCNYNQIRALTIKRRQFLWELMTFLHIICVSNSGKMLVAGWLIFEKVPLLNPEPRTKVNDQSCDVFLRSSNQRASFMYPGIQPITAGKAVRNSGVCIS